LPRPLVVVLINSWYLLPPDVTMLSAAAGDPLY
jgi:hypothetical protein